jgi:energy-coupling factor transporter ATP-binding protein EcfA2
MIERLEIQGLRGILEASLQRLAPLTVLLGPNGAGKSTILDALLLAASPNPAEAVGRIVRRRTAVKHGAPWVLWKGHESDSATISINSNRPDDRICRIRMTDYRTANFPKTASAYQLEVRTWMGASAHEGAEHGLEGKFAVSEWIVALTRDNEYEYIVKTKGNWSGQYVRLVDPAPGAYQPPLPKVYSLAVKERRGPWAQELLRKVIPGCRNIEILTDDIEDPVVYVVYEDRSVPVGLAGDGIQVLTRVCLELAGAPGGLVLLEEPEAHQHPRSLMTMSLAITETLKRNVQVVLSTHSLDLIRFLIEHAKKTSQLDSLAVFQLRLDEGKLIWSRIPGADAEVRLESMGDDLR